jgi:dTDP-glucose 4,6-dehydratase
MILVTGGCGFIGSSFVLGWLDAQKEPLVNLDLLTYAGHACNLEALAHHSCYHFVHGDIGNTALVAQLLAEHRPRAVVHFAAETHVDRSIAGPMAFVHTNVVGTMNLLETTRDYWCRLDATAAAEFRFLQVSTDEVYGSLAAHAPACTEEHRYAPNSPYAASKAAADHLVRAYHRTYGLPTLTTHCPNNYGPRQFPEKLIPLMILNALHRKPLPVYGDGQHIRHWLHVQDHCVALRAVLQHGRPGERYNLAGVCEKTNLEVVHTLCRSLDALHPAGSPHAELIAHVKDRPGHDRRYALDGRKTAAQLGWQPATAFADGLHHTVAWYLAHTDWVDQVTRGLRDPIPVQPFPGPNGHGAQFGLANPFGTDRSA